MTQQTWQSNFTLDSSGFPFSVVNSVLAGSSLTVVYVVNGNPSGLVLTIEGIVNASGDVALLDSLSYSSGSPVTRTVTLGSNFDLFRFIALFSGQGYVSVSVQASGSGQTFNSSLNLVNVKTN